VSDIRIRRKHGKTPAAARAAAEHLASELQEEFELNFSWRDEVMHFTRSGLSGELSFVGDEVVLCIRLGFLLSAFRANIEREVHKFFDENFAA
jgi:putative polyhydroxyalkanoate system protein